MTKFGKYRIKREFNRKTFDTNPKKRHNYVHQRVRFNAYLIIDCGSGDSPINKKVKECLTLDDI